MSPVSYLKCIFVLKSRSRQLSLQLLLLCVPLLLGSNRLTARSLSTDLIPHGDAPAMILQHTCSMPSDEARRQDFYISGLISLEEVQISRQPYHLLLVEISAMVNCRGRVHRLRCLPLVRLPYLLQIRKLEEAGFWLCHAQKSLA